MSKLSVKLNDLTYVGSFEKPAIDLWGGGAALLGGLLEVLSPFGATVDGVSLDSNSSKPSEQAVVFQVGQYAQYRFAIGSIRAQLSNFGEQELVPFSRMIGATGEWVREHSVAVSYRSHVYSYWMHADVIGSETSESVLRRLSDLQLEVLGTNRGAAITFHALRDEGEQVQLSIDHSLAIAGGLFVHLLWTRHGDAVNHQTELEENRRRLDQALAGLGLEIDRDDGGPAIEGQT